MNECQYPHVNIVLAPLPDTINQAEQQTPIGIMPERIWKAKRIEGLQAAISRYIHAGIYGEVLREWCRELDELLRERKEEDA